MVHEAGIDLDWLSRKIEYRNFQECVHCGLARRAVHVLETGNENDSPRGRIYLMRAVADGRLAMGAGGAGIWSYALTAGPANRRVPRACSMANSSSRSRSPCEGRAGRARAACSSADPHHLFPYSGRVNGHSCRRCLPETWFPRLGREDGPDAALPPTLRRMQRCCPSFLAQGQPAGDLTGDRSERARVALFLGCVGDAMFPETNAATARVLQRNGCEVVIPRGQVLLRGDSLSLGRRRARSGIRSPKYERLRPRRSRRRHRQCGRLWRDAKRLR